VVRDQQQQRRPLRRAPGTVRGAGPGPRGPELALDEPLRGEELADALARRAQRGRVLRAVSARRVQSRQRSAHPEPVRPLAPEAEALEPEACARLAAALLVDLLVAFLAAHASAQCAARHTRAAPTLRRMRHV
jgi:hypothetical protein